MIAKGADVHARSADGTTALHWAVYNDDADLVQRLIKAGADVSAVNDYGASPLRQAAVVADSAVIKDLVKAGANVNETNPEGETPLMIVARTDARSVTGFADAVKRARLYLEAGADAIFPEALESKEEFAAFAREVQAPLLANNTEFGLTGSLYTTDEKKISRAKEDFFVGNLYFNRKSTGALVGVHPFGGFNMSGTDSKAGGRDYLLLFMQAKSISRKTG